jgi:hypothetical protein
LATKAVWLEEAGVSETLGKANPASPMPWERQIFVPIIVTSADIFTCSFDPADVKADDGEIPFEKAILQQTSHLFYEYPLPRHLQDQPSDVVTALKSDQIELFMRMHILVVHSEALPGVLDLLAKEDTYCSSDRVRGCQNSSNGSPATRRTAGCRPNHATLGHAPPVN